MLTRQVHRRARTARTSRAQSLRARAAFTLLEMMLVIVIMGILIGVATFGTRTYLNSTRRAATQAEIARINQALNLYNGEYSAYPDSLQALVPKYLEKAPKDAWKAEFVYRPDPTNPDRPFILYSLGPSGVSGAQSDRVDFWDLQK